MRSQLLLSLGLATLATAQFSINRNEDQTVVEEINNFLSTATNNPTLQTLDIPALEKLGAPTSAILAAETDPAVLIEAILADATNTALLAALPTPIISSLRTILAKPLLAVADVTAYLDRLVREPGVAQTLQTLEQVVPPEVQRQVQSAPVGFLEDLVTATTVPGWVTGLPEPVQVELASVLDKGLSIVDKDFRATDVAGTGVVGGSTGLPSVVLLSGTGAPYPITTGSAPVATGTGTGTRGARFTGSGAGGKPSSSPFLGGAERVTVGVAAVVGVVGAGVLAWL